MEPGAGVIPMSVRSRGGYAEGFPALLHGQASEIAQLDEPCGRGILAGQLGQSLVDGQELVRCRLDGHINGIDVESLAGATALFGAFLPRTIDEDTPHRFRRGGKEMASAIPALLSRR